MKNRNKEGTCFYHSRLRGAYFFPTGSVIFQVLSFFDSLKLLSSFWGLPVAGLENINTKDAVAFSPLMTKPPNDAFKFKAFKSLPFKVCWYQVAHSARAG